MSTIKEDIQKLLESVDKVTRSRLFLRIRKNAVWMKEIESKTSFLDFDANIATRLYYYLNGIDHICECKYCGKPLRRNGDLEGTTFNYCSRKCSALGGIQKSKETKKERYGSEGYMNPEKVRETWNKKTDSQLSNIKRKHEETSLVRYGVTSPSKDPVVKQKIIQTNLKRHGCECVFQSDNIKEVIKQSNLEKYGVDNPMKNSEIASRFRRSYNQKTEEEKLHIKQKRAATCSDKFGVEYVAQNELIRNKISATHQSHSKSEVEDSNNKRVRTCNEKYGVDYAIQSSEIQAKSRKTLISKYGVPFYVSSEFRRRLYCYDDIFFDSSYELYYYIWARDVGKNIKRATQIFSFIAQEKLYHYMPDFLVDDELVEIKGEHFFDSEGNLINPFSKDPHIQEIYREKGNCARQNNVRFVTDITEQKTFVDSKYTSDFVPLFRVDLPFPYVNESFKLKSDLGVIQHFHKSIYLAKKQGFPSPLEAWKDKTLVKKCALNRLKYVKKCRPSDILQGFNVAKIAPKVSVFDPDLAKTLISKYISEEVIIDPFSGFSGRLLGAIRNNKQYIGYDLNEIHVQESNEIVDYFSYNKASVKVKNIFETPKTCYKNSALFTCPPYSSKESWNGENDVSLSCDEWIEECLNRYDCSTYLFVVDKTTKFCYNVVETIENKSHFGTNFEYVLLFRRGDEK